MVGAALGTFWEVCEGVDLQGGLQGMEEGQRGVEVAGGLGEWWGQGCRRDPGFD